MWRCTSALSFTINQHRMTAKLSAALIGWGHVIAPSFLFGGILENFWPREVVPTYDMILFGNGARNGGLNPARRGQMDGVLVLYSGDASEASFFRLPNEIGSRARLPLFFELTNLPPGLVQVCISCRHLHTPYITYNLDKLPYYYYDTYGGGQAHSF